MHAVEITVDKRLYKMTRDDKRKPYSRSLKQTSESGSDQSYLKLQNEQQEAIRPLGATEYK